MSNVHDLNIEWMENNDWHINIPTPERYSKEISDKQANAKRLHKEFRYKLLSIEKEIIDTAAINSNNYHKRRVEKI